MTRGLVKKGQSTLELTVALIIFVVLFAAAVRIFVWLNVGVVDRQVAYDNTRRAAGSTAPERVRDSDIARPDGSARDDLEIVGASGGREVEINEPLNADLNLSIEF